jgi:hypothetical protein
MDDLEFRKCLFDFPYFASNYVKVLHPLRGIIPFELYPYHERVVDHYAKDRCIILKKFRQAGLFTMTLAWTMWKCMFNCDRKVLWVSPRDRDAVEAGKVFSQFIRNLPEWLAPIMSKDNAHEKNFLDTNSTVRFVSPAGARTLDFDWLILDECAFIPKMDDWWKALSPRLETGGRCIALSTPNGRGNWFEKTYTEGIDRKNSFSVVDVNYLEHPDYQNTKWVEEMKKSLGLAGWTQEVLASFD